MSQKLSGEFACSSQCRFGRQKTPLSLTTGAAMQRAVVTTALPIDLRRIDPLEGD